MSPSRKRPTKPAAAPELNALREAVATMRDLGVLEWNGIKLGPVPTGEPPKPTEQELRERALRVAERRLATQFAHSSIRPVLRRENEE